MTALAPTHGSVADVLVNGNVVSQYFNDFTFTNTRDKAETSAFKSLYKSYVAGLIDSVATLTGWYDPNIDIDLWTYLTQITAYNNQWLYAPNGAQGSAAAGNYAYSITGSETKYEIKSALNAANSVAAEIQMSQSGGGLDRGIILSPWMTQGAAGSSASNNYGSVSSTNGGVLVVHTFSDTASLVVTLQDSADNATWANVGSYAITATNSTIAAYRYPAAGVVPTGTIRQYTRVTWTGTGTFLALFSRK